MPYTRLTPDTEWAAGLVAALPAKWERRLLSRWEKLRTPRSSGLHAELKARFNANTFIRQATDALAKVRVPLDASDAGICEAGEKMALRCTELAAVYHSMQDLHAAMQRLCVGQGVKSPKVKKEKDIPGAVARMTDPQWWRRKLRAHHGQTLEASALALGYVHKNAEIYCSNETLYRRRQQNARNAAMLEATIARNELGQEYKLAELAATGLANKAIRRAELMTRISGFERIAMDCGHRGVFLTSTCPSHMHQWRTLPGGRTEPNPRYDGHSTPGTSQKYQAKLWSQIRSKLDREGITYYGFRVAEPNHDGTPHWHFLLFMAAEHVSAFGAIFRKWALKDSPDEPGAQKHRVDVKYMEAEKGTASGYIAKYIAKNIDGYRVDHDLYGNPAIESSERVEAWARTWRIRQFQQVGGPPVGVWRELRRVEALPAGAPAHLVKAHNAVNKVAVIEGRDNASVAWHHYCEAQGGVFVGKNAAIQLDMQPQEGLNRYGEEKPKRPVGVCTYGTEYVTPEWMRHMPGAVGCMERRVWWEVASKRYEWEIIRKSKSEAVSARPVSAGGCFEFKSARRAPWTCVNNCTEVGSGASETGPRSVGKSTGAHQGDGRGVHGAGAKGAGGNVREPWQVWREGHADWLQGDELLQWQKQHLHGPWLSAGAVQRGPVFLVGGKFVQNGIVIGDAGGRVAFSGG